jgi:hypothetical protein
MRSLRPSCSTVKSRHFHLSLQRDLRTKAIQVPSRCLAETNRTGVEHAEILTWSASFIAQGAFAWKREPECGALLKFAFDTHLTTVRFYDLFDDG